MKSTIYTVYTTPVLYISLCFYTNNETQSNTNLIYRRVRGYIFKANIDLIKSIICDHVFIVQHFCGVLMIV